MENRKKETLIDYLHADSGYISISSPQAYNPNPDGLMGVAKFTREAVRKLWSGPNINKPFSTHPIVIDVSPYVSPFDQGINIRIDGGSKQIKLDLPKGFDAETFVGEAPPISFYRTAAIAANMAEAMSKGLSGKDLEAVRLRTERVTRDMFRELGEKHSLNLSLEDLQFTYSHCLFEKRT